VTTDEERFIELSLELVDHARGALFAHALLSFPSEKFHEWCRLAQLIEEKRKCQPVTYDSTT